MELDLGKVADDCMKAINEKIKNLKQLNIIVAGKTGVGKSTLINGVFREPLAETGIGKPVTTHMRAITKDGFPLCIYDTRGFELGKNAQEEVKKEILDTIKDGIYSKDTNKAIHCIWYCINATSDRLEEEEMNWLKSFTEENKTTQVPVIIVLTKSISQKQVESFKSYIADMNLNVAQIVPVLAKDYEINDEYTVKAHGLDILIQVMGNVLDEELLATLQNVQKVSLDEKVKYAHGIVAGTVTAAFLEGFIPIPFSDAALLIPTQVTMIASITAVFGLDINKSIITAFVSSILGSGSMMVAGKTIVANLLKMIPGAGSIAGGTISGATAALLTTALGEGYIQLMVSVSKGELKASDINTKEGQEKMKMLFKKGIKEYKKK